MRFALCLLVCLVFAAACGPTNNPGGNTNPPAVTCPSGQTSCDDACTNVRNDEDNCGTCGNVCGAGQTCVRGVCTGTNVTPPPPLTCNAPAANCDGNYGNGCETNLSADNANCGSCGARCNAGFTCTAGRCAPNAPMGPVCGNGRCESGETCGTCAADCGACTVTCSAGTANCDGNVANGCETNTNLDVNNCGACGARCNGVCVSGSCIAQPTARCGDGTCNGSETCGSCPGDCGACPLSCSAPTTNCSGSCVNLTNDSANCGACGRRCTGTASCVAGVCTAPSTCESRGMTTCSGACVNLQMDNYNCGACGANCAATGWICSAGRCVDPMPRTCSGAGQAYCGGRCVDVYTDSTNCGACGANCGTGRACMMGVCGDVTSGLRTFRAWYNSPSGVTVSSIAIYQFSDHNVSPGYLQAPCSIAGGMMGVYTNHACSLQARAPMGYVWVNTQVQLSAAETVRMGGRTTTWACAIYSSGGPMVQYGTMGLELADRSLPLTAISNGRDGCNFQAPVY